MSPHVPHPMNPRSLNPVSLVIDHVRAWPTQSQQGARRNAMIATTALAARRAEREDVDDFFDALTSSAPQPPLALHN
jgi:hypothetical protein